MSRPTFEETTRDGASHVLALDGVRGLAIAAVLVFHQTGIGSLTRLDHAWAAVAGMGWRGVDLFFVLSGYLITGALLDSKTHPHGVRNFYARRLLRIVPACYALLFLSFIVIPALPRPEHPGLLYLWEDFTRAQPLQAWFWTFTTNIGAVSQGSNPMFGLHGSMWSLALEEQFYLLWPWAVRTLQPRQIRWLCAGMFVGAFVFRAVLVALGIGGTANYVLAPARMDCLAAGAWVATMCREADADPDRLGRQGAWAWFVAASLTAYLAMTSEATAPTDPGTQLWSNSPVAVACAGMVLAARFAPPGSTLHGVLTWAPLRSLGRHSYSIYLLNLPVFCVLVRLQPVRALYAEPVWGSNIPAQVGTYAAGFGVTWALAVLSWHLLEKRALALKRLF